MSWQVFVHTCLDKCFYQTSFSHGNAISVVRNGGVYRTDLGSQPPSLELGPIFSISSIVFIAIPSEPWIHDWAIFNLHLNRNNPGLNKATWLSGYNWNPKQNELLKPKQNYLQKLSKNKDIVSELTLCLIISAITDN